MGTFNQVTTMLLTLVLSIFTNTSYSQSYKADSAREKSHFQWPEGKKMGLSLTFDDARLSQADKGIPLLDKYNVKATFYLSPDNMIQRLEAWKKAVSNGHEIGNHSLVHPCTGNFDWSRNKALEDYTLQQMSMELDSANKLLKEVLGIRPVSFAFPCGQTFVGRGMMTKSYVPLISSMFETGRGWLGEGPNDPAFCDMAQITGMELDGKSFDQIKKLIESAKSSGKWLVLAGHEMNEGGNQTSLLTTIEAICQYASDPANGIWIDNVHNIASYIKEKRGEKSFTLMPVYKNPLFTINQRVEDLISRMTLEEKVGQLNMPCVYVSELGNSVETKTEGCRKFVERVDEKGVGPGGGLFDVGNEILGSKNPHQQAEYFNELQKIAMEKTRLGIPLLQIEEGTHGFMCAGGTVFPEGLAIGSTFDMDLVSRIYKVAAKEARSTGVHLLNTLVIEPNLDPRMGRNEEGYSEDQYLVGRIAENITRTMQGYDISGKENVVASFTDFPGQNPAESGLERGAVEVSERKLREVLLPPWVACFKQGALSVMAGYPAVDGVATHGSEYLLTKILRNEMGFEGIVLDEGGGIGTLIEEGQAATMKEAGALAIKAGVDVGISYQQAYLVPLIENVKEGKVNIEDIDRSLRRILNIKFKLGLFENPYVDPDYAVKIRHTKENMELALQASREGIVLLKNEKNILPLKKEIKSIAVIGPNADAGKDQVGDYSPHTVPQEIQTVLKGLRNKISEKTKITYVKGCNVIGNELNEIEKAKETARNSDVAIVVLGESGHTDGESRDVTSLDLTGLQEELLKAVHSTGTPTIVVLINGRPLSIRWAAENSPAVIEAWNCGEQGGNAVADVLFGDYNPGGKLPITVPRHVGQLPVYYNHSRTKREGYVDMPATPLYEFGYGLSYTTFEYSNLQIFPDTIGTRGEAQITLAVKNTGKVKGDDVVQLYIQDAISSVTTPIKELRGFKRISLEPGETKTVSFKLLPEHLSLYDQNMKKVVEPGVFDIMIGSSSEDIMLKGKLEVK
jgi:beta-glucosidase